LAQGFLAQKQVCVATPLLHTQKTQLEIATQDTAMAEGAVTLQVAVPDGVAPGQAFAVTTPDGQVLQLTCPDECGPGSPVMFSYIPLAAPTQDAAPAEGGETQAHPDDVKVFEEAAAYVAQKQEELMALNPTAAVPFEGEFQGNAFPPAVFAAGQNAIVTRSSGEESGCSIYEVFLTAMGPQYNVYLGQNEAGEPIFKWCGESDLRAY